MFSSRAGRCAGTFFLAINPGGSAIARRFQPIGGA